MSSIATPKIILPTKRFPYELKTYCGINFMGTIASKVKNPQYTGKNANLEQIFYQLSQDPSGYSKEELIHSLEIAKKIANKYLKEEEYKACLEQSEAIIQTAIQTEELEPNSIPEHIKRFYVSQDLLATQIAANEGEEIRINALIKALHIPDPQIINFLIKLNQEVFIQIVSENDPIAKKVIMKALKLEAENVAVVSAGQKVDYLTNLMVSNSAYKVWGLIDDNPNTNNLANSHKIFVTDPIYKLNPKSHSQTKARKALASFIIKLIAYSEKNQNRIANSGYRISLQK